MNKNQMVNSFDSEILMELFEISNILNLNVKHSKLQEKSKYIFKYKNRTIFIAKITDSTVSISINLWLLDMYYENTNIVSFDVLNEIEQIKAKGLVYDMFGTHCISYGFRFNQPSMQVISDLKNLLQEEVIHIKKLTA